MKNLFKKLVQNLLIFGMPAGYIPCPKLPKAKPVIPVQVTTQTVNEQVRKTLTMARDFYARRGDRIVSVDLQNYLDAFEDILLMSATDGASVETAKLLGQVSAH